MKKIIAFSIVTIIATLFSFNLYAQLTTSVQTFYPAPYGAYNTLYFRTQTPISTPCEIGTLANDFDNNLMYCDSSLTWNFAGGPWIQKASIAYLRRWSTAADSVGIGSFAPSLSAAKFLIAAPDNSIHMSTSTSTSANNRLQMGSDASGNPYIIPASSVGTPFDLRLGVGANPNDIVLKPSGRVGIGTTNPTDVLDVTGQLRLNAPTLSTHIATKGYVDTAPTINVQSIPVTAANCPLNHGGVPGTQIQVCHTGGSCTAYIEVSKVICYPINPL